MEPEIKIRTITVKGKLWLNQQDLVQLLMEFAGSEATDTRNRICQLAENIEKMVKK